MDSEDGFRREKSNLLRDDEEGVFFSVALPVPSWLGELVLVRFSSSVFSAYSAWLSLLLPRVCTLRLDTEERLVLLSFAFRGLDPDAELAVSELSSVRSCEGCGRKEGEDSPLSRGLTLALYKPSVPRDAGVENGSARTCLRNDS